MAKQLKVMISSTARDLPRHRQAVMDACLRLSMFPIMMEHSAASNDEAVTASVKMVDEADIYLLILAHRYGYVPVANNPDQLSVTEREYNHAIARKIPILTFTMHKDHPLKAEDVEKGEGALRLEAFRNRALLKVANFFKSPADLRADVIASLSHHREPNPTDIHYVSEIPAPPETYIAHPYTLLQTHTLVGRQSELKLLTDWITGKELEFNLHHAPADSVRIMSVVAMGGMGKSALTWKWFNDVAPQATTHLAGRMWWSFYESDAGFENFVTRALAYVSKRPLEEIQQIPAPERERKLLAALDHEPFLFVLDGLERILIAYARIEASRLDDSEVGKEKGLRKTADPRVGSFLKKLAQVKHARILISSRLYPTELETAGGDPIPRAFGLRLEGLTDDDAVELWSAFRVSGSRRDVLTIFNTFGKHPLLIQALAGEVRRHRKAPGNFEDWRKVNDRFDPTKFAHIREAMGHVLEFALQGIDEKAQRVVDTIAAFRMPAPYDTLAAVLVGENRICATEPQLDSVLSELEDRGLLGWDKRANRYDLHPIVRGVVWSRLTETKRRGVFTNLHARFETLPIIEERNVSSLEDLTSIVELYNMLIGLSRYDEAFDLFSNRLYRSALYKLNASRQCVELLEMLFTNDLDWSSQLKAKYRQAAALTVLGLAFDWSGRPGRTAPLLLRANVLNEQLGLSLDLCVNKSSLSSALQLTGRLRESESTARAALQLARQLAMPFVEASSLFWLGLALSARSSTDAGLALYRALTIARVGGIKANIGAASAFLSDYWIRLGDFHFARPHVEGAWSIAENSPFKRLYARVARRQGTVALGRNDLDAADEKLHIALKRARLVNFVEEELPSLIGLAELRRRQRDLNAAREFLNDAWEFAERGPYPLLHADAFNVLAQIERDEGNIAEATEAATKAYRLAWCDGPPFAYHWGLEKAKQHLKELGAPEPEMPPFDESKFEPMPEVEIDPDDEFHVGESFVDSQ